MQCISQRIPDFDYDEPRELTPDEEREAQLGQLRDEAGLARRKAVAIQKLLNGQTLSQLTVPTEYMLLQWHASSLLDEADRTEQRILELETPAATRKSRLREEWKTLQRTWMLHDEGQRKISARQSEIEAEIMELEAEQMEVSYVGA